MPVSTLFERRIPKQKFYDKPSITPPLKRFFVEQINNIYWRNKIAPSTLNVAAGNVVTEIEVFEIRLNQRGLDKSVLPLIDKEIPYHILFLLTYEDEMQAWINYKEESKARSGALKSGVYYHTAWVCSDSIILKLDGLNMDMIYENFIRQIAGKCLTRYGDIDIKVAIANDERRSKLVKEVAALEKKVRCEKQFNVQVELNNELKQLKKKLEYKQ